VRTLQHNNSWVYDVAFSPDGTRLATAGDDGIINVWDATSNVPVLTLQQHARRVFSVAFSPDGAHLATASADRTAKVWDVTSGTLVHSLPHTDEVDSATFSSDRTRPRLATASKDGTIRVWNVGDTVADTPALTFTYRADTYRAEVGSVAFSPDGMHLAAAIADKAVYLYTLNHDELILLAKTRITRSLTPQECQRYLQREECPPMP
jgi:WD40 repeat protein